ncbi:ketosteroid isomerase-like protein [Inquilinus ginsengisoli]|uniref:nuclear transport factor 2 family protein n=1 Tax=Inquilinus ginsengisoli TaxID=363840 RepID=UPI003D240AEE
MTARTLRETADALIAATNAFDVNTALAPFHADAVIDDPSTGHRFDGHPGIRDYVERYFIGYHSVTRFLSIETIGETAPACASISPVTSATKSAFSTSRSPPTG